MPNFPSIYLELQELWKRIRGIDTNLDSINQDLSDGVSPSGPAGGILSGTYPNPEALQTIDGVLNIKVENTSSFITGEDGDNYLASGIKINNYIASGQPRMFIIEGISASSDHRGGTVRIQGGSGDGDGGAVQLIGGYSSNGDGGGARIIGGKSDNSYGGEVLIYSGDGTTQSGEIIIATSDSLFTSGDISIRTGNGGISGDIILRPGTGASQDAYVRVQNADITLDAYRGIRFGNLSGNVTSTTLDDYEEGTWTPDGSNFSVAPGNEGKYIKIGNFVYCWGKIYLFTAQNSASDKYITGLPYSAINNAPVSFTHTGTSTRYTYETGLLDESTSRIYIPTLSGGTIVFSFSYET